MTGIATAIWEPDGAAEAESRPVQERYRAGIKRELAGVEKLAGTYPFTIDRSVQHFRLNDFLHRLVEPDHRRRFLEDPEALFEAFHLPEHERRMIRDRDWRGLIQHGAIFFMLEKLGAVVGVSNLHIYAAMRGETLEEFQKTRQAPGALYSVAGQDAPRASWEAPTKKATERASKRS